MPFRAICRPSLGSRVSGGALRFVTGGDRVRTAAEDARTAAGLRHEAISALFFTPLLALSLGLFIEGWLRDHLPAESVLTCLNRAF